MTRIGLPVPPGFTITRSLQYLPVFRRGFARGSDGADFAGLKALEQRTGKGFGDKNSPLLVSVRSGAAISMPGMMDTILNLGLNDEDRSGIGGTDRR